MPVLDDLEEDLDKMQLKLSWDGMTGVRVARQVPWGSLESVVPQILGHMIMAGEQPVIVAGEQWPGIPRLRAKSVDIRGEGQTVAQSWQLGPAYQFANLTVSYETSDNEDDEDDDDEDDKDGEVQRVDQIDYDVEIMVVPMKVKASVPLLPTESPSDYPGGIKYSEKEVKRHIRIPTITYTVTYPKVVKPPFTTIRSHIGKINSSAFLGGAAGTVLFDGPSLTRNFIPYDKKSVWKFVGKFIYQRNGWNKQLHPETLKWVDALDVGGDGATKPYETADLSQLFVRRTP